MRDRAELHQWLAAHHEDHRGFWLVQWRPSTGRPGIAYEDVVEECLIFGWIDSTVRTIDDERNEQRLTPRKPTSVWSASNKQRVARLAAAGLMQPAGLRAVEVARTNGMYTFLDEVEALVVPEDLASALGEARASFEGFSPSRRRQALAWIKFAKRASTRADRIAQVAAAAEDGRSLF